MHLWFCEPVGGKYTLWPQCTFLSYYQRCCDSELDGPNITPWSWYANIPQSRPSCMMHGEHYRACSPSWLVAAESGSCCLPPWPWAPPSWWLQVWLSWLVGELSQLGQAELSIESLAGSRRKGRIYPAPAFKREQIDTTKTMAWAVARLWSRNG